MGLGEVGVEIQLSWAKPMGGVMSARETPARRAAGAASPGALFDNIAEQEPRKKRRASSEQESFAAIPRL